jgi:hypothetical protein
MANGPLHELPHWLYSFEAALRRRKRVFGPLIVAASCLGGCQDHKSTPAAALEPADGRAVALAVDGGGPTAQAGVAAVAREPFVPREAPEAWATWPMPNSELPGLPNPQKYEAQAGGVVVDEITGLMWQRNVANEFVTFDDAQRECGQLKLAGYEDWRLPSRIELVSILDTSRTQPSINLTAFPGAPSEWFWTSSVAAGHPNAAWFVYFYSGFPKTDDKGNRFSLRCVRNATPRVHPAARYDVGAGTVRDVATGLTWQRAVPDKKFPLAAANAYCGQLTLGGKKGWRVPSAVELFTLIDEHATAAPLIDSDAFPKTPGEQFWSSSFFANGPALAWYVFFDRGDGLYGFPKEKYRVRCVV